MIGSLLRERAAAFPDRPFCHVDRHGFTFGEMNRRSDAVAAGFAALGVSKGDRVATLMPNRVESLELFFGLAKLGAVQVPLNAFLKGAFLRHQLAQSRSSVLVTDREGSAAVEPVLAELAELQTIVTLDEGRGAAQSTVEQVPYDAVRDHSGSPPQVALAATDTMSIAYTSGTTGLPKGCVLSHGYYTRSASVCLHSALGVTSADVLFAPLPLFHGGGRMVVLTGALVVGIPVHFSSSFSASSFIAQAAEIGATVVFCVGAMGMALLATPPGDSDRRHHIHTMMVAPLGAAEQERLKQRFGIEPWTNVFGQTECMPATFGPRGDAGRDRGGCGVAAPDIDLALLGDGLDAVADGEIGEICLRPREPFAMFDGYWGQPAATLEAFRGGWYHTGDYGRSLPSGELAFVDRKKDALRRRGENVSSIELEASILTHPKIADVAVHAVPSPSTEDDIKACIVLARGESISPEEMFDFFRERLPYFAAPRYVEILGELPRNAVGRVMKHVLRERAHPDAGWDLDALGLSVRPELRR